MQGYREVGAHDLAAQAFAAAVEIDDHGFPPIVDGERFRGADFDANLAALGLAPVLPDRQGDLIVGIGLERLHRRPPSAAGLAHPISSSAVLAVLLLVPIGSKALAMPLKISQSL